MSERAELIDLLKELRDALDCSEPYRPQLNGRLQAAIAKYEAEPELDWRKLAEQAYELLAIDTADSINGAYELLHTAFNGKTK